MYPGVTAPCSRCSRTMPIERREGRVSASVLSAFNFRAKLNLPSISITCIPGSGGKQSFMSRSNKLNSSFPSTSSNRSSKILVLGSLGGISGLPNQGRGRLKCFARKCTCLDASRIVPVELVHREVMRFGLKCCHRRFDAFVTMSCRYDLHIPLTTAFAHKVPEFKEHRKVHAVFNFINDHNAISGSERLRYNLSNRITPPPRE